MPLSTRAHLQPNHLLFGFHTYPVHTTLFSWTCLTIKRSYFLINATLLPWRPPRCIRYLLKLPFFDLISDLHAKASVDNCSQQADQRRWSCCWLQRASSCWSSNWRRVETDSRHRHWSTLITLLPLLIWQLYSRRNPTGLGLYGDMHDTDE